MTTSTVIEKAKKVERLIKNLNEALKDLHQPNISIKMRISYLNGQDYLLQGVNGAEFYVTITETNVISDNKELPYHSELNENFSVDVKKLP